MNNKIMPIGKLISDTDDCEFRSKACLFSDCKESPIRSHTIPENALYKLHYDLTKVFMLQPNLSVIVDTSKSRMRKVNKEKFSTFEGFCNKHDNDLFSLIDEFDGNINKEKAALSHYRNICYGIIHIQSQLLREQLMSRQCYVQDKSPNEDIDKLINKLKKGDFARRLKFCLSQHLIRKKQLEGMIKSNKFGNMEYFELHGDLDSNPIFCGRSSYLLHQKNKFFTQSGYSHMPWLSYMTLLTKGKSHLVFCWLKADADHTKYFKKLLENSNSKKIIEVLAWACSDAFAVEESVYNKHAVLIDEMIKKYRVY